VSSQLTPAPLYEVERVTSEAMSGELTHVKQQPVSFALLLACKPKPEPEPAPSRNFIAFVKSMLDT